LYAVCIGILLSPLAGCSPKDRVFSVTAGPVTALITVSGDEASTEFFAMDTLISVSVRGREAARAVRYAVEEVNRLEDLFSVTRESSDVWRVNRAGGAPVGVSYETAQLLSAALGISRETGGAFDVKVRSLVEAWGFDTDMPAVPGADAVSAALASTGYQKVSLSDEQITLPEGMQIDLGGIAKGYAAQHLCRGMEQFDVECAIFSLGGNVQTWGAKRDGSPWNIAIRYPSVDADGYAGILACKDTAVVTSGSYERYFIEGGVVYGHILDPRTGESVGGDLASVTVVCEDGTRADALSTALFVMGMDGAADFWRKNGGFSLILVTQTGEVFVTEDLDGIFTPDEEYSLIRAS